MLLLKTKNLPFPEIYETNRSIISVEDYNALKYPIPIKI